MVVRPFFTAAIRWPLLVTLAVWGLIAQPAQSEPPAVDRESVQRSLRRSVEYLSREVAIWKAEHNCYSCHNHGDGARALFAAKQKGIEPSAESLKVAGEWLRVPDQWDHNGPDGPFSDRKLARISFAAALAEGVERGILDGQAALNVAAERLVGEQLPSGAWDFVGADSIGAPTTYGRTLATVLARRALVAADRQRYGEPIRRSDEWLRKSEPRSVLDSSAVLIGLRGATDEPAIARRKQCRDTLQRGQGDDGGWGPFATSAPEPFDTALAILALDSEPDPAAKDSVSRGVAFLVALQQSDGSWPETTRPLPRESYSQRISTTAWVTLALLETL